QTLTLPTGHRPVTPLSRYEARERVKEALLRLFLDPLHVVVAEAEMVTDLVDHDMADDVGEGFAGLAPVVQQRTAIEIDHVVAAPERIDAAPRHRDPAIEAEQIEGRFQLHLPLDLIVGKI